MSSFAVGSNDYGSEMRKNVRNCGVFIWNNHKKEFLCRTFKSWILIILFYIIFFIYLIALEIILIIIFFAITWRNKPYVTGEQNILRLTPGVQIVPHLDQSNLVFIYSSNANGLIYKTYSEAMKTFFKNVSFIHPKAKVSYCSSSSGDKSPDEVDYICPFNISDFGPCSSPLDELLKHKICIYLTIDNIYGYLPNLINNEIIGPSVSCEGTYTGDTENINSISYYPNKNGTGYFSHIYFPFTNQIGYKKPYMALHLSLEPAAVVFMECKLGNVDFFKYRKFGLLKTNFEIVFDGPFY